MEEAGGGERIARRRSTTTRLKVFADFLETKNVGTRSLRRGSRPAQLYLGPKSWARAPMLSHLPGSPPGVDARPPLTYSS